ncbi:alpha/beta-hydrolase, partial [Polychaeton citri CBS 116435]
KLSAFKILDSVPYKQLADGQTIPTSILIPKKNFSPEQHSKLPIIVRWHGGGLITGHRLFPDWMPDFILSFAKEKNAIVLMPDYRLLPESKGVDIIDDVRDFLSWLSSEKLSGLLPEGIEADWDKVVVNGESAGGWLALQSAFVNVAHQHVKIQAVVAHYPMIDMRSAHFSAPDNTKHLLGLPLADPEILHNYLAKLQQRDPGDEVAVTSRFPPAGLDIFSISAREGLYTSLLGTEPRLYPIERLDDSEIAKAVEAGDFPPVWILHGSADTAVPVEGTLKFEKAFKQQFPSVSEKALKVSVREGEEHGFE